MKKLSSGTEKDILQAAMRLAEILSLENIENKSFIESGKKILEVVDDPTIVRRFKNGREQKLEIIRDVVVDLSAGAPWLKKGCFGLVAQNNMIKKVYLLDDIPLKGQFLYKISLAPEYKKPSGEFKQADVDHSTYYMIYLWSQFIRALAKNLAA